MATASTVINSAANARQPNLLTIYFKEAKYEFLKSLRYPMYSVSTMLFPVMFYVLFGLVMGRADDRWRPHYGVLAGDLWHLRGDGRVPVRDGGQLGGRTPAGMAAGESGPAPCLRSPILSPRRL